MKKTNLLRDAWGRLIEAQKLALACHQRPDGDALGSALALSHVLKQLSKDVVVIAEDGVPETLEFIPESDIVVKSADRNDFDLGILIDCEVPKRAGKAGDTVKSAKTTGCIDHHIPDNGFGDIRVIDTHASSTAELMVELFTANDIAIDETVATQLMAGIVNDTGAFRFANTTPNTLRCAALLMESGAKPSEIARAIYETRPLRAMKLLGRALSTVKMDDTGCVAWAIITKCDLDELGATDNDTDGIVNYVGHVKGPKTALLFREAEPNSIRVSLRSKDGVDVNQIARVFGGGGHPAAAGCTLETSIEEAQTAVVNEVLKWMES